MRWDALRAITRRALRINYKSPMICVQTEIFSGSASGQTSTLDLLPILQEDGPTLSIVTFTGQSITLSWTEVPGAFSYVIYRATNVNGPFVAVTTGLISRTEQDYPPGVGTFYYKVTGLEPNFGETAASNVVSFTI